MQKFQFTSPYGDERSSSILRIVIFIFQLTSPQGDEPVYWNEKQKIVLFQFTSPRGDELKMARVLIRVYHFNSRLRKETNVAVRGLKDKLDHYFNSRLRKETNQYVIWLFLIDHYFNSRLLGETNNADDARRKTLCDFKSRFLAETNGFLLSGVLCQRISTRVSARRRTLFRIRKIYTWGNFNSHLRKETNLKEIVDSGFSIISIHVSLRRRTGWAIRPSGNVTISIHVSLRRRTLHSHCYLRLLRFQFTSPQGDELCALP